MFNKIKQQHMKKIILTASALLILFACQNAEDTKAESTTASSTMRRADQVESFKKAITEINKPQYAPTKEDVEKHGSELSDERKQILLQPAKDLIIATGVSEAELSKETTNDILNKAFKIYVSQTAYQSTK